MTDETLAKVLKICQEEIDNSVDVDTRFDKMSVDSLDFLLIIQRVRNEVGPVQDKIIGSVHSISDLAAAVGVKLGV